MFIHNNWRLRFLVGVVFVLLLQPATATDDKQDMLQSRELTGGGGSPPWATGSICTPDGPFYIPAAAADCKTCCQERKCHNICLNQCKNNAASTAQNRKDFCRSYDGYKRDGTPTWPICSDKLGEYKESNCGDYDGCVTKYEARHVANDAWYYCDDLKPPRCTAFAHCVYEEVLKDTNSTADAEHEKREALKSCEPHKFVGGACDGDLEVWHPGCGHGDWTDACRADHCDDILKDLQYAHSKSGSKGRHAVCDEFWECVNDYERYDEHSESREKGDDARRDCRQCENSGRNCKDVVGDDHEQGKDDVCLDSLGGWDRSCNSYYDCWNSRLKGECEDCANGGGTGCFNKYDSCKATCMASPNICQDECDVCFCESNPGLAIDRCQAIGDDCCKDPYGWHNDPEMKSYRYIRECSPSNDCGTCGGNCNSNADCHGVNVCSKDFQNPRDMYDIPGCKGDPAKVKDRNGNRPPLAPEDIGYCYKPPSVYKYPDRTSLINSCLAETTTNGYGRCCGLPQFAEQCGQTFNNYCDSRPNFPIIQPGTPGTGTDASGTPIFEAVNVRYTDSYCGTSVEQICSSCPSNINDVRECSDCTNDPDPDIGCFSNFICEGCLVQTGTVERSGEP